MIRIANVHSFLIFTWVNQIKFSERKSNEAKKARDYLFNQGDVDQINPDFTFIQT